MDLKEDPKPEEGYNEDEDDDFNPDVVAGNKHDTSSDDTSADENTATQKKHVKISSSKSHKRPGVGTDVNTKEDDLDFENSGDEGIIKEGSKAERKQKRKRRNEDVDEDSGGDGGFVKTRSMRAAAEQTVARKSNVLAGKVTADIDAVWQRLIGASIEPTSLTSQDKSSEAVAPEEEETITINRTYKFAGKIHTETKVVAKSSAQAQAYLATKDSRAGADSIHVEEVIVKEVVTGKTGPEGQILSQPRRRISSWDPNPTGFVKGLPSAPTITRMNVAGNALKVIDKNHLGGDAELWQRATPKLIMRAGRAMILQSAQDPTMPISLMKHLKAQKLNVVDKSKLDWAEHVDTIEGARQELEQAKKDKTSYLERRDFLNRVEDNAESERSKARGVVR